MDKYLEDVVYELNENCCSYEMNEELQQLPDCYNISNLEWTINDISYNIDECRDHCITYIWNRGHVECYLCDSCKSILNNKIKLGNNSLYRDINTLKNDFQKLEEKMNKILEYIKDNDKKKS